MLCDNCRKEEATVRYLENINGEKRELHLCEKCSKKLGIEDKMQIHMGLEFPSLFGGIFEELLKPDFMPLFNEIKDIKCESCGISFDDIVNEGKLGCPKCYETFEDRLDPILKRIQGTNKHVGRLGKIGENKINIKDDNEKENKNENKNKSENKEKTKLEKLEENLKQAIKEERYEDAAKYRDEIKKLTK